MFHHQLVGAEVFLHLAVVAEVHVYRRFLPQDGCPAESAVDVLRRERYEVFMWLHLIPPCGFV